MTQRVCLAAVMLALAACTSPIGGGSPIAARPDAAAIESLTVVSPTPALVEPTRTAEPTVPIEATEAPSLTITLTASPTNTPSPSPTPTIFQPRVESVAEGLGVPSALAFAKDGRLFFTERPGRIRVIAGGRLQSEPLLELGVVPSGKGGLMGLALDPEFEANGHLYVMYTYPTAGRYESHLAVHLGRRARYGGASSP